MQVFWSGGIGDIITLEATFNDEYRSSITKMYWATRTMREMAPIFSKLPSFPNLIDHISLWNDFDRPDGTAFRDLEQVLSLTGCSISEPVDDWSLIKRFIRPQPFTYSSFIKYKVAEAHSGLPRNYIVICPYSTTAPREAQKWRRFSDDDWDWLLSHLNRKKQYGVVLNVGDDPVPQSKWLINLSNKTGLAEAIEITKNSTGYIGIGTSFSVIAAQIFPSRNIKVCAVDDALYICKRLYYAPKTSFDFLCLRLRDTRAQRKEWRNTTDDNAIRWLQNK